MLVEMSSFFPLATKARLVVRANMAKDNRLPMTTPSDYFSLMEINQLEKVFMIYDYDHDNVLDQSTLRQLLRRLHINWTDTQFVRVTQNALGGTW